MHVDLKELISALVDGKEDCAIVSSYKLDTSDSLCPSRVRAMLASRACHTSCTVGDALTKTEMQRVILLNTVDLSCFYFRRCFESQRTLVTVYSPEFAGI